MLRVPKHRTPQVWPLTPGARYLRPFSARHTVSAWIVNRGSGYSDQYRYPGRSSEGSLRSELRFSRQDLSPPCKGKWATEVARRLYSASLPRPHSPGLKGPG